MLRFDEHGIIVDTSAGDGGDSANRAGLLVLCGQNQPLELFESDGLLVRHPNQTPWNNPKNFSRDQLLPFVAGAWKSGRGPMCRRIFWAHARRFFFAQNFERDIEGSRKRPWPHRFLNDRQQPEFSVADFADPLMPDQIWHLILCAQLRWFYFFGVIGYPWLAVAVVVHGLFNRSNDEGQLISQCVRAGRFFRFLYRRMTPDYHIRLTRYWQDRRDQPEMRELLLSLIEAP